MKQLQIVKCGALQTSLNSWKGMPKQDKTPTGYSIKVNGADLKHPQVMLTGGGAFPAYTYVTLNGECKWFAGHFDTGTAVEVIEPKVEAAQPAATPAPAAEVTQPVEPVVEAKPVTKKSNKK